MPGIPAHDPSICDTLEDVTATYLSVDDIVRLHEQLVEFFDSTVDPIAPSGVKSMTLLGSAASRPQTSLGRQEKYESIEAKAAALFHSLVKNHPFHNGNKRTALVALLAFLDRNDRRLKEVSDDDVFEMVVGVAAGTFPQPDASADDVVTAIAQWLGSRTSAKRARASVMKVRDFLDRCEKIGLPVREDGMGWKIQGRSGMVKIQRSTREIPGNVLRIYLQNLGMSEAATGIGIDEFQDGISGDKVILHRFHAVLKRLANS